MECFLKEIHTNIKNQQLVHKRRRQIVAAASKLFMEKGFHKTTIREIAEGAGLSQGAVYDYIESKEDILLMNHQIFLQQAEPIQNQYIDKGAPPLEKLRQVIRTELKMMDLWSDNVWMGYREYRHLPRNQLREVLKKEREHVNSLEAVVEECVEQGILRPSNTRLISNLIKILVEAWVLKQWDLQGYTDLAEIESAILQLIFQGWVEKDPQEGITGEALDLKEKRVLVVNAGTSLGSGILSYLVSHGARTAAYLETIKRNEIISVPPRLREQIRFYSSGDHGRFDSDLLKRVSGDMGGIDIYIQDLGLGHPKKNLSQADHFEENLADARRIADGLRDAKPGMAPQICVVVTPWAWDRWADPIGYEIARSGGAALVRILARDLASTGTRINGIAPGFIRTPNLTETQKKLGQELTDRIPLGGLGDVSDITRTVGYLISDASKYMTGQTLEVSGGCLDFDEINI